MNSSQNISVYENTQRNDTYKMHFKSKLTFDGIAISAYLPHLSALSNSSMKCEQSAVQHVRGSFLTMTSSNGNIFRVSGPLCGEFTGHR